MSCGKISCSPKPDRMGGENIRPHVPSALSHADRSKRKKRALPDRKKEPNMKILLADRDRDFLSGYRLLLQSEGHTVVTCFDGTQVLSCAVQGDFDLAAVSTRLPRTDSRKLIDFLNESRIPLLLFSADSPDAAGAVPDSENILYFPFEPAAFMEAVLRTGKSIEEGDSL